MDLHAQMNVIALLVGENLREGLQTHFPDFSFDEERRRILSAFKEWLRCPETHIFTWEYDLKPLHQNGVVVPMPVKICFEHDGQVCRVRYTAGKNMGVFCAQWYRAYFWKKGEVPEVITGSVDEVVETFQELAQGIVTFLADKRNFSVEFRLEVH